MLPAPTDPEVPLREWASIHSELLWIYDHDVPSEYRDRRVEGQRTEYRAWLIHEGSVQVESPAGGVNVATSGMWLFPPREVFRQQFSKDARILSIHFLCSWPSGESLFSGRDCIVLSSASQPLLERRSYQLKRVVDRYFPHADTHYYSLFSDYGRFLTLHTVFLKWLTVWIEVMKQQGVGFTRLAADDDRVMRAVRCLNNATFREGYPRDTLIRETGLSETHLNRLFFDTYGMTTRKSWEARRLNEARRYLETGRRPVKEIAYTLGFRTDSHFMIWFKKATGKRPTEYRKVHRTA